LKYGKSTQIFGKCRSFAFYSGASHRNGDAVARQHPHGIERAFGGILGGLFLIAIGAIWPLQNLPGIWSTTAVRLAVFSSYLNLCTTFFAAAFSTNRLTPLAGSGQLAAAWKENIVTGGLVLSSVAMVSCCILLLWGLRRAKAT
jgi:(hydroxyamino)benzene mutase